MKKVNIILLLMLLGIVFAFPPIITTNLNFENPEFSDSFSLDNENLRLSALSAPIYIDDNNPSANWSVARDAGKCTGNGTYSDPYIIEDLEIDGGGSGSCIFIENSNVYFRIENCSVTNSGSSPNAGLRLDYVDNGELNDNNCSFNSHGISLSYSDNNTISGNTANNNYRYGISLGGSNNNISGNTANYNDRGIVISSSNNTVISGNTINYNSWYGISLSYSDDCSITGNIANNNLEWGGISIHYGAYNNITGNTASNNGAWGIRLYRSEDNNITGNIANNNIWYGIYLYHSGDNIISGNTANYNELGIYLYFSDNSNITGNIANYNVYGIYLQHSNYNIISGNTLIGNGLCIVEISCQGNEFSDNGDCTYGEVDKKPAIPGYNLFFLLGILSVAVISIRKKVKKN